MSLTLTQQASMFATVTLRSEAVRTVAVGTNIHVFKSDLQKRGELLSAADVSARLSQDHDDGLVGEFFQRLARGGFHGCYYRLADGGYGEAGNQPQKFFAKRDVLNLQDPVDLSLKLTRTDAGGAVLLTVPGLYLDNLPRVAREYFVEAAFRALGFCDPVRQDSLWLFAGIHPMGQHVLEGGIQLSVSLPKDFSASDYEKPGVFPPTCLDFGVKHWKLDPRRMIGSPEARERVSAPRTRSRKHALEPEAATAVFPSGDWRRVVADLFLESSPEHLFRGGPRLIALTKPSVRVEDISLIPREIFHRAVVYGLGGKEAQEGDRVVFMTGRGFAAKGRVVDCLLLSPAVPESRKVSFFPKVWMEYRSGQWVILPQETQGTGGLELQQAVLNAGWGIQRSIA